jgi:pantoate--beta-alanine ligase
MKKYPIIIRDLHELRGQIWEWRGLGKTIGFVPTMGSLHEGHLSLVRLTSLQTHKTVASIFVNPTQFAPGEDFENYPRSETEDIAKLASAGCDLVYIPRPGSMYGDNHATSIQVGGVAKGLETNFRSTFFDGVSLVVTKLLNRVAPDVAIFGEKDYQQLATIRQLVMDLDLPINIIGGPIVRDEFGLALSSRNNYFDEDGLRIARMLNVIMDDCAGRIRMGHDIEIAVEQSKDELLGIGFDAVDYISAAHPDTLVVQTTGQIDGPMRLLIAAHCKGVRLIDNCAV